MSRHRCPVLIAPSVSAEPTEITLKISEKGWIPYKVRFDTTDGVWIVTVIDWKRRLDKRPKLAFLEERFVPKGRFKSCQILSHAIRVGQRADERASDATLAAARACSGVRAAMSVSGQSRPIHSAPVPTIVCSYSNSKQTQVRSDCLLNANNCRQPIATRSTRRHAAVALTARRGREPWRRCHCIQAKRSTSQRRM